MTKWISSVELNQNRQRINSAEPTPCELSCRNTTTRGQSSSIGNTPEQQDTSRDIHMVEFHSIPFQSTTVLRRHYLEGGGCQWTLRFRTIFRSPSSIVTPSAFPFPRLRSATQTCSSILHVFFRHSPILRVYIFKMLWKML